MFRIMFTKIYVEMVLEQTSILYFRRQNMKTKISYFHLLAKRENRSILITSRLLSNNDYNMIIVIDMFYKNLHHSINGKCNNSVEKLNSKQFSKFKDK